jgi:hypothetical protein
MGDNRISMIHVTRGQKMLLPKREGFSREEMFPGGRRIPLFNRLHALLGVLKILVPAILGDRSWAYVVYKNFPNPDGSQATSVICAYSPKELRTITAQYRGHYEETMELWRAGGSL